MGFFDKLKKNIEAEEKTPEEKEEKKPMEKTKKAKAEKPEPKEKTGPQKEGLKTEGQLAIDVYETDGDFIIQSTIAGIKAEDLDITIENDMVTIQGSRQQETEIEEKKYFYQECYWGAFSRQIILPQEVDGSKAEATMKEGILILKIPKAKKIQKRKIAVRGKE